MAKIKHSIYFGHPLAFWRERKHEDNKNLINVDDIKKLSDVADYDNFHLQQSIFNRAKEKVEKLLKEEDIILRQRRNKLRSLLENEEIRYSEEIQALQRTAELIEYNRKEVQRRQKEEELEKERKRECQKALEREKIAKGMHLSKADELELRTMQKMQLEERRMIEEKERAIESMWHQVLIENVRRKESAERQAENRRQQEMLDRRRTYDEQIASANARRQELIKEEREKENRRLNRIRERMEKERIENKQRKIDQQNANRVNHQQIHNEKVSKLHEDWVRDRQIDEACVQQALFKLQEERRNRILEMKNQQKTKEIFIENYKKEQENMKKNLETEENLLAEWEKLNDDKAKHFLIEEGMRKDMERKKLSADYRNHIAKQNLLYTQEKETRFKLMESVRKTARDELNSLFIKSQNELQKQMEYRKDLDEQIRTKQRVMAHHTNVLNDRLSPFTRRPQSFRDKMKLYVGESTVRQSTNPVHPFKRFFETAGNGNTY